MKIYTTVEAVPSRIAAVVRLLAAAGPLPEDELIVLLQPPTTNPGGSGIIDKVLPAAAECGVIIRDNGKCGLAQGLFPPKVKLSDIDRILPKVLARLLLQPRVNGQENLFAVICSWFLHRRVDGIPRDPADVKNALSQNGLPLAEVGAAITNRFHNIIYWLRYLGFAVQTGDRFGEGLIPDPTLFLRRHLDELIPPGENLEIHRFILSLGAICPVLDGGVVRSALLARIDAEWPENVISDALAFALERLDRSKELRVWCPDDQRTFMVTPTGKKVAFLTRTE
jgi:hypothetical protein